MPGTSHVLLKSFVFASFFLAVFVLSSWEKNKTGVCQYASGSRYEGLWLDGLRHGEGVFTSSTGDAQAGVWHRDESITLPPPVATAAVHEETTSGAAPESLGSLSRQEEAAA